MGSVVNSLLTGQYSFMAHWQEAPELRPANHYIRACMRFNSL